MLPHLRNLYLTVKQKTKLIGPIAGKAKIRGLGIFQKAVSVFKTFDIRRAVDAVNTKLVFAVSGALAAVMVFMLFVSLGFRPGYHVYLDGEFVASITDKEMIAKSVNEVQATIGGDYEMESEPTASFAIIRSFTDDLTGDIIEKLPDITKGIVLKAGGEAVATFANSETATATLLQVLELTKAPGAVSAEFTDNIDFEKTYVKRTDVTDAQTALDYLTSYETEPTTYTLGAGEDLDSVSEKFMITKDELLNRNTALTEADFREGTEIVTNRPKRVLSVKSEFSAEFEEEIPFETEEIDDPGLYEGVTFIKTAGEAGTKKCTEVSHEIDGVRIATTIVDEVVTRQPVKQIEVVGSKTPADGTVTGSMTRPTTGIVTSRYGSRWGRMHNGVDIGGNTGDPIKAADGGTVVFAGDEGDGYGIKVILDHGDGSRTLYAHCSAALVTAGIKVGKGDVIAKVGNTGDSTGPHLHFEVTINGQPVNPMTFINED